MANKIETNIKVERIEKHFKTKGYMSMKRKILSFLVVPMLMLTGVDVRQRLRKMKNGSFC